MTSPPPTPGLYCPSESPSRPGPEYYRADRGHPYTFQQESSNPPTASSSSAGRSCPASGTASSCSTRRPTTGTKKFKSKCQICSYTQEVPGIKKAVYHEHFSSLHLRRLLGLEDSRVGKYLCPSCKSHHSPYPNERSKIVISDSTLHNFFAPPGNTNTQYEGDIQHTDYITIPGATLETLLHAFKQDYATHPRPMDVYLVAGYNDLVQGHSRDYILDWIKYFVEYVLKLPPKDNSPNTITIGTFFYPPQLAWFKDNGPEPPNYHNQKDKLNWLNRKISELNLENKREEYVGIHKFGMRVMTRKTKDRYGNEQHRHIKKHRWEHWRESDKTRMLHLNNDRRFKLGKAINEYFVLRT